MRNNNYRLQEEIRQNKEFVENLIHESISLMDENIELVLENERLRNRLEKLGRLYKRMFSISDLLEEGESYNLCSKNMNNNKFSEANEGNFLDQRLMLASWREKSRSFDKGINNYSINSK